MRLSIIVLTNLLLGGCGGGGSDRGDTVPVVEQPPAVTSFTASAGSIVLGESLTLTPVFSNGLGTIDNGIGAVTSGTSVSVTPSSDTNYTLTVSSSSGASVVASVSVTVDKFRLTVVEPSASQLVHSDLSILATIQSTLDIVSVSADVQGLSTPLIFSADESGFVGQLSLVGLSASTYSLTVTAEDVEGDIVSKELQIILDNLPVLTVTDPLQFSVARPDLLTNVTCTDDVGDCAINVVVCDDELGDCAFRTVVLLASGVNTLSEILDLSAYDGHQIPLSIQGKDSSDQVSFESRLVFVESSANLIDVKDFSGAISDFDGQNSLIVSSGDNGDSLTIVDITTGISADVEVPPDLVVRPTTSFLTPTGAIYAVRAVDENVLPATIYDWNNSLLQDLGHINSSSSLRVAGDYAIWSVGSTLWRRQLSTRTNIQVSTSAGNWKNAVGSNGVVAYWSRPPYVIERYDAGVYTTLASDVAFWNTYVETDGTRFVYRKSDPCCNNQQYAITYHDGTNETVLTNFRDEEPSPGRDYQINNGWVAFTKLGGLGQTHVWTNDPAGTPLQRTVFGSDSYIDGLSADGEVMLINSGSRYLSDTTGQLTDVSSSLGSSRKINGIWYITIGRSLFEVM